jgi:hypothetical protein
VLKLPDWPPDLMSVQLPPPELLDELLELDELELLLDDELEELDEELLLELEDELELEELLDELLLELEDELLLDDELPPPNCASIQPWKRSQVK